MKERHKPDLVFLALTSGEDLLVGAVEGQAEDVGQVFPFQLHRLGASVDGFFHVPQKHPAVVSTCGHDAANFRKNQKHHVVGMGDITSYQYHD